MAVDKWLDEAGQGQIFVETGSFSVAKRESPYILVSQRPTNSSRNFCNLEVFAAAGKSGWIVIFCRLLKHCF